MATISLRYTKEYNSLNAYYLESIIKPWFSLTPYNNCLQPSDVILLGWPFDCTAIQPALDLGCKVIVDNLQESNIPDLWELIDYRDRVMILTNGDRQQHRGFYLHAVFEWFWYFESLWYQDRGYDQYTPDRIQDPLKFLMSIGQLRDTRDAVVDRLSGVLDSALWSYTGQGRYLPNDCNNDTRWFNPDWYNSTLFSVVNETNVHDCTPLFWTEKTSKPLAFYHPFVVIAQQGLLAKLRNYGFETFPELFDESYDQLDNVWQRIDAATAAVIAFDANDINHPTVQEKLQHNRNRFFNTNLVHQLLNDRLVKPMQEFVETCR